MAIQEYFIRKVMQAGGNTPFDIPNVFRPMLLSGKITEKYYLMAAKVAKTQELKANSGYWDIESVFSGKYFSVLKARYEDTKFYEEVLKECGYFKSYNDK